MPDFTNRYDFNLPIVGGDNDDWGTFLNENWERIDTLITVLGGARKNIVLADANYTLTNTLTDDEADARHILLVFSGALTANRTIFFPTSEAKIYFIANSTTGGFNLTLQTTGGAIQTTLPPSGFAVVHCNGAELINAVVVSNFMKSVLAATAASDVRTLLASAGIAVANTFAANQTISNSASAQLTLYRTKSPGVNGDDLAIFNIDGHNSAGSLVNLARIHCELLNATAGNERIGLWFATTYLGIMDYAMALEGGMYMLGATDGDKGRGTINAVAYYQNGVLYPSPSNVATLSAANVFLADQIIRSNDATAVAGPFFTLDRNSATPAANDFIGNFRFRGRNSVGAEAVYGHIRGRILDPLSGSEDGEISIASMTNGVLNASMFFGAGVYLTGAVGGDRGVGTINATAVYDDGAILCAPIEEEQTGTYDETKWSKLAPHGALNVYESMKGRGFDVSEAAKSFKNELELTRSIPGYFSVEEWQERTANNGRISIAEREERMLLALDVASLAIKDLTDRQTTLEAKIAALTAELAALKGAQ